MITELPLSGSARPLRVLRVSAEPLPSCELGWNCSTGTAPAVLGIFNVLVGGSYMGGGIISGNTQALAQHHKSLTDNCVQVFVDGDIAKWISKVTAILGGVMFVTGSIRALTSSDGYGSENYY